MNKIIGIGLSLFMAVMLSTVAMATEAGVELNLADTAKGGNGAITITSTGYTQNYTTTPYTGAYTITGSYSNNSTGGITIESGTHNITIKAVDITYGGLESAPISLASGVTANITVVGRNVLKAYQASGDAITVPEGATLTLTGQATDGAAATLTTDGKGMISAAAYGENTGAITIGGDLELDTTGIGGYDAATSGDITIGGNAKVIANSTVTCGIGGGYTNIGTITIKDNASVTATGVGGYAGIGTSKNYNGNSIGTIRINTTGTVTANGGNMAAGIGVGGSGNLSTSAVSVEIQNGIVNATGGTDGAGIGGGLNVTSSGTITISGGTVTATGAGDGAGIGAGSAGNMDVTITGGNVTATGAGAGADIGGAHPGIYTGTVTISGGTVTAENNGIGKASGNSSGLSFSTGKNGNAMIVTPMLGTERSDFTAETYNGVFIIDAFGLDAGQHISNQPIGVVYGTPTLSQNATIPSGKKLTIEGNNKLTIPSGTTLTNEGTLSLGDANVLTGNGTLSGNGIFQLKSDVITDDIITLKSGLPFTYTGKSYHINNYITVNTTSDDVKTPVLGKDFSAIYDLTVGDDGNVTGWTRTVTLDGNSTFWIEDAGTYTITYTKDSDPTLKATKTYTMGKIAIYNVKFIQTCDSQFFGETVSYGAYAYGHLYSTTDKASGTFKFYDKANDGNDILLGEIETDSTKQASFKTRTLGVGTHSIYAMFTADDKNFCTEPTLTSETLTVTVKENTLSVDNGSSSTSVYDGTQKTFMPFSVKPSTDLSAPNAEYTISYKLTSDTTGSYSTTPPTMVNVGEYNLSYLIQAEGYADYNGTVTYTITPATNNITPTDTKISTTYNGKGQTPDFAWENSDTVGDNAVTIVYSDAEITATNTGNATPLTYQNAGTYTICYKISAENHTDYSDSFTFTINPLNVSKENQDLIDYTIIASNVSFVEPTLYADDITSESITGTFAYTYETISDKSYTDFIAEMNTLTFEHGTRINIGYTFSLTGNYKGTISGNITTTVQNITFDGSMTAQTTATYGDIWGDILNFANHTYSASVGDDDVTGTYTLKIEGNEYDSAAIPTVGKYDWVVTFASDNGDYIGVAVASGAVEITNAAINDTTEDTETVTYTGNAISITPPTGTTVNGQILSVTYSTAEDGEYNDTLPSHTLVDDYTIWYKLSAPNHADLKGSFTFTIQQADSQGTITDKDDDDAYVVSGDTVVYGETYKMEYTPTIAPVVNGFLPMMAPASLPQNSLPFGSETVVLYYGTTEIAKATGITLGDKATLTFTVTKDLFTDATAFDGTADTFTIGWGGDNNATGTSQTISLNLTQATIETVTVGTVADKTYTGLPQTFTAIPLTSTDVETGDTVILTVDYTTDEADAGDYAVSGTVTKSGADAGYYALAETVSFTGNVSIDTKDMTETKALSYAIVEGHVAFVAPTFDGVNDEDVTGTMKYTYNSIEYTTYESLITVLDAVTVTNSGDTITVGYEFTANGNYTGTISGDMTMTVYQIVFDGDMIATTATYGTTWDDILDFTQETYSAKVGNDDVTGTYTLKIEDVAYDSTAIPTVGNYDWTVTFTSNDGTYENISVDSGAVTVGQRTVTYTWDATTFAYDGTAKLPTPTITNAVGEDTVTVTATGEEINVGDSYTAIAVLTGDNGNYALPTEDANATFAITSVEAKGTIAMAITDTDSDETLNEGDVLTMTYTHTLEGETPTYQWYKDDVVIQNATDARYTLTAEDTEGDIHCVVTLSGNTTGTLTGETATIGSTAPSVTTISTTRGNGTVTINWTVENGGSDITGYSLSATYLVDEVATDVGGTYTPATNATSYTVTGLTNGTEYTFVLTATNDLGSTESEEVTGIPYQSTSSGGSYTKPTTTTKPTTEDVTKPDGTTTTTTTATVTPTVSNGHGTTSSTVKDKDIDTAIDKALDSKDNDQVAQVEIKVESKKDTPKVEVSLTTDALTSVADSDVDDLTITTDIGAVTVPSETAKAIASQAEGKDITVTVEQVDSAVLTREQKTAVGDAQVYDLHITSDDKPITTFGGHSVTVTLPYELAEGESAEHIVIWYLADNGTMEALEGYYDAKTGKAVFATPHLSYYVALHYNNPFADVAVENYFFSPVMWAVENGITNGTTATTFSPDMTCTRAQAVTFLWNAAGKPRVERENPFTDVDENDWYYEAVLWAVENGITNGTTATTFSPNADCTRSQIVTFLWNAEKKPVVNYLMTFEDVAEDTWYTEAVRWAVSESITEGTSATTFDPTANCTRAQIVTFLYRNMGE